MAPDELIKTQNADANEWAKSFCEAFPSADLELMRTWFACAITTAQDAIHNKSPIISTSSHSDIDGNDIVVQSRADGKTRIGTIKWTMGVPNIKWHDWK